jgi:hypothetical protein
MLKNYVTDNELKAFYPTLDEYKYGKQTNYTPQLKKAFDILLNDLYVKGINPLLCMKLLDLNNYTPQDNPPLTAITKTATFTSTFAFLMGNRRRFVVNATACTGGTWTIKLQGNNRQGEPALADAAWEDVPNSTLTFSVAGEQNIIVQTQYKWVRLVVTKGTGTSITLTSYIVETVFDDAICYRALALLYSDWKVERGDKFDERRQDVLELYDATLASIKFTYDTNEDGVASDLDSAETITSSKTIEMTR